MKVRVNYDFTHRALLGEKEEFELAEGTKLGELLRIIDGNIFEAGKNKCIDTTYKTILAGDALCCMVFINGSGTTAPEQELHDGDALEFVYGFCGG